MSNLNTNVSDFQPSIAVVINAFNAENRIEDCIDSALLLTDNCIVVDFESSDKTVDLAKKKAVRVVLHPYQRYIEPVRNYHIKIANADWVFLLDDDEIVTKELADEIKEAVKSYEFTYYRVPRKEYFAKKVWLQHGGWWPNYQARLIKKSAFENWPSRIHSFPVIEGKEGHLKEALLHFSKNDYEDIVRKTINFEDIESDLLYDADKPVDTRTFFRKFFGELYRRLFKGQGYKDGDIGIIESIYQAFSKTITYLYLYEKKNSRSV